MNIGEELYCFGGNIAFLDLTTRRVSYLPTVDYGFWGGRGLNQYLLLETEPKGLSAFDSDGVLVFGAGRLVGTGMPGAVRLNIDGKNVFTSGIGSSSMGGMFASALKSNGLDHLLICGRSPEPVYLLIQDKNVEIRSAKNLWGLTLSAAWEQLGFETGHPDIECIAIGPAGENEVWGSAVLDRRSRAAARCGLAAVMGNKKLKAIAAAGRRKRLVRVADRTTLNAQIKKINRRLAQLPAVQRKRSYGTVAGMAALNAVSATPVKNFEHEYLPEQILKQYNLESFGKLTKASVSSCRPCPIRCQHRYEGAGLGPLDNKLEINSVWGFGTRLGIVSPTDIVKCHTLCSQNGLDIDNTTASICWALDCYEHGLISKFEADGLELTYGNVHAIRSLLHKITYREGIGDLLSRGTLEASRTLGRGSEKFVFHVKGQDIVEPVRSCKGWALGIAVSPRGATHTRGAPQTEFQNVPQDLSEQVWHTRNAGIPTEYEGKAEVVVYYERLHAILDALGICFFVSNWSHKDLIGPEELIDIVKATIGEDLSVDALMLKGERIMSLEKIYNSRNAKFTRQHDYLPEYFMQHGLPDGPLADEKIDRGKWDEMLDRYYELHKWDRATGVPLKATLQELNLGKFISEV